MHLKEYFILFCNISIKCLYKKKKKKALKSGTYTSTLRKKHIKSKANRKNNKD